MTVMHRLPVLFLLGPTAAGKTELAIRLRQSFPLEIISVDSAMVYCGLDIGTSKPSIQERTQTPHRLIDICEPNNVYSAAQFRIDALHHIQQIIDCGRIPLLVGGTMMYFHSLEYGLSPLPEADKSTRDRLIAEATVHGWEKMHAKLTDVDSISAKRIHPNDTQRLLRALEVYEVSGSTMSELLIRNTAQPQIDNIIKVVISPQDRHFLHRRIENRFYLMLEQGFQKEVESLYSREGMHKNLPSMKAVGYRQMWSYLDNKSSYEDMVKQGITATRRLAKHQFTWLRGMQNLNWFDCENKKYINKVLKFLESATISH